MDQDASKSLLFALNHTFSLILSHRESSFDNSQTLNFEENGSASAEGCSDAISSVVSFRFSSIFYLKKCARFFFLLQQQRQVNEYGF